MAPNLLLATPSWVNSLTDSTIKADITADIKSGSITFGELEQLFEAVAAESTVIASGLSSSQFNDLQTVVSNLTALGASSYVDYIATSLVDGNVENYIYTGGISGYGDSLGNLAVGSAASILTLLTDKWFVGADLASTTYTADGITGTVTYQDQSNLPLYSAGGPSISDINQGPLQDSFLLAGLAELVHQDPSAITQMIHSNGDGTYGVRFFLGGQAIWMTVNSSIAMSTVAGFTNSPALNDAYVNRPGFAGG